MATNVAAALVAETSLAEWDGYCLELVNALLRIYPYGDILWVEPMDGQWTYHAVLVLDGIVHDAWHPGAMLPPEEYVATVFGDNAFWEMNPGKDDVE